MASTLTATAVGADGLVGGPLTPEQESEASSYADREDGPLNNLPEGHIGDVHVGQGAGAENGGVGANNNIASDADGEDGKGKEQHLNDPTPMHKSRGFFQDGSQGELQIDTGDVCEVSDNEMGTQPQQSEEASAANELSSKEPLEQQHQSPATKRKRRVRAAIIEGDASNAFSHYRPVVPLSSLSENVATATPPNELQSAKKKRGKRRRDKRDHKRDRYESVGDGGSGEERSRDGSDGNNASVPPAVSEGNASDAGEETASADAASNDPMHILEAEDDPILHNYLPQLAFLSNNYYSRVKPYRMGKRDLPPNQIEVILRRRAVKKRADVEKVERRNGDSKGSGRSVPPPPPFGRPPLQHQPSPPRRTLFPTQPQQSPTPSSGKGGYYEDDSTISSTTVASQMTPGPPIQIQQLSEPPLVSQQQLNGATAIAISEIPREEVVGDTSLGLKLTILQGKVIVQKITPLEDGRASPAQLCGLLSPGDIIVAVNGKSLINGTIHNPVGMDKTISVLKPLSKPMDEETKEYSREVRLRFVLGEGKPLLREQQEREKRKLEDRMHRKKLGLDGPRGAPDPAADLFGIGALMGVDQHSGMPMFAHLHHHHPHHEDDEKEEKKDASSSVVGEGEEVQPIAIKSVEKPVASFTRKRPSVQAQIARQIQLDRQWYRNRNTSGFYALDDGAPVLLRPPSPPPDHSNDPLVDTSINARKQRLERGAQTMADATSLVAIVEAEDRGIQAYEDEDPMEVASRVCGTASIRTGSSKRRWHRGDSASVVSASSAEPNIDMSTRSGWSGVEACDHRLLVELAANDDSWKANVIRRLEAYAEETEKERAASLHRGSSDSSAKEEAASTATGFDGLLFGGDVANMLAKKKQSLALPPGEMTSMLYDLVELLEVGLPDQIFMKDEAPPPLVGPERTVSFAQRSSSLDRMADVAKANDFLIHNALGKWLKSFRPLPWKQRRALWPSQPYGGDGDSTFASSRMDDNESLSMMSGSTAAQKSRKEDKRNLRELIEDLELDHETRRETCALATFYFTRKFSVGQKGFAEEAENEAAAFLDEYGSYVDIYKCLVAAGKLRSRVLVDKLLGLARYDYPHKGAVKALQKAKALLFYEPAMLSALHELLPSISSGQLSGDVDFAALLVSAYPDLQPWCVREASESEDSGGFYKRYLSSLLHHEEGNAAAKRDEALVKEWCLKLCAQEETNPESEEANRQAFYHVASRDDQSSLLYRRDLPFLMDVSVKMEEFGLTLDLADEIVSSPRYCRDKQVLTTVLDHLATVIDRAVEGNEGEINAVLLTQAIAFFDRLSPCVEEHDIEFDSVAELSKLLEKCHTEQQRNPRYSSNNVDACVAVMAESASPDDSLQVLSQWKHSSVESPVLVSALHTSLVRGAREGVRKELSGSLLRIQRAREERRGSVLEEEGTLRWNAGGEEEESDDEEEGGEGLWEQVLDGTLAVAK